jgi:hypothetical protein
MFCLAGVCSSGVFGGNSVAQGKSIKVEEDGKEYRRLVEVARKEIGVLEEGCGNCGAHVARYLAYAGVKTPAPWCAAWVSWCYGSTGKPQPRTAWSPGLFPQGRLVEEPEAGYVFGIYYPALKRIGHCGIIERVQGDMLCTIEANTNIQGGREGIGVFRRLRHKRTVAKYADWIRPIPP